MLKERILTTCAIVGAIAQLLSLGIQITCVNPPQMLCFLSSGELLESSIVSSKGELFSPANPMDYLQEL
ncbi:MAG: hypothetical protein F6K36_24305 [Symploca sp. SIO3C6]|nr:hypothetical protein [Symploca sp. SIO3C6]